MEKKICSKCHVEKLTSEFYVKRDNKDKFQSQCKVCMNEYNRLYRANNPEKTSYKKRTYNDTYINFRSFTPKDILKVPEMLEKMGYDTTKDIHTQFINRVNTKYGLNLKKKSKPKDNFSKYFPEK
jgi:hypothetical protein